MVQGFLTTHVLDTSLGKPAHGVRIHLYQIEEDHRFERASSVTNQDGRTDNPMLSNDEFRVGRYELIFHAGDYFRKQEITSDSLLFLDEIPIRFGIADPHSHYHVPLLLSPYGYSTYRGS
ncbi:MAG: hydroxyisourate hydrolase [Aestuariivita sp.]|nr:hydroxyisourate hydrolase [Aestuariivita sp.]